MADPARRIAADARRILRVDGSDEVDREQSAAIREVLTRNYDRGRRDGRAEREAEHPNGNVRIALLDAGIATLQQLQAQTSVLPQAEAATAGYREAIAILKDAKGQEERLPASGYRPAPGDAKAVDRAVKAANTPKAKKRKAPAKRQKARVKADG